MKIGEFFVGNYLNKSTLSYCLLIIFLALPCKSMAQKSPPKSPAPSPSPALAPILAQKSPPKSPAPSPSPALASILAQKSPALSPAPSQVPVPNCFSIAVISDINGPYGSTKYPSAVHQGLKLILEKRPDLVICAGDMIGGQSKKLSARQIGDMWDAFGRQILQPLSSAQIPFLFTLGNHDGSSLSSYADQRKIALDFLKVQRPEKIFMVDEKDYPVNYSLLCGLDNRIFLSVIDASSAFLSEEQFAWLEKNFRSEQCKSAEIRVVLGHLPIYPITQGRDKKGEYLNEGKRLYDLLEKYQVQYYISGHHHGFYCGTFGEIDKSIAIISDGDPGMILAENRIGQTENPEFPPDLIDVNHKDNGVFPPILINAGALGDGPRKLLNNDKSPSNSMFFLRQFEESPFFAIQPWEISGETLRTIESHELPDIISFQDQKLHLYHWPKW